MSNPYTIKRKLNIKRNTVSVSSEGYIINQISNYMEQFGMMEKRTANNSLNYFNMDPMKSLERRRQIRNISFDVEI